MRPRRFADPAYFPSLHRRQVIEAIRRASPGLNPARLTVVPDKQEPPNRGRSEGSTDAVPVEEGQHGRYTQSA